MNISRDAEYTPDKNQLPFIIKKKKKHLIKCIYKQAYSWQRWESKNLPEIRKGTDVWHHFNIVLESVVSTVQKKKHLQSIQIRKRV